LRSQTWKACAAGNPTPSASLRQGYGLAGREGGVGFERSSSGAQRHSLHEVQPRRGEAKPNQSHPFRSEARRGIFQRAAQMDSLKGNPTPSAKSAKQIKKLPVG